MRYLPLSDNDRQKMLERIGVTSIEDLYEDAPKNLFNQKFDLPDNKSELEVVEHLTKLSKKNKSASDAAFFLGAGCYRHFIPAAVDHIIQRAEFLTSYTPYQPEISQGTLTVIFEYQSLICSLTGMEVSNASLYDGATALVEAVLMAKRINKKKQKIVVANDLNPQYYNILQTYLQDEEIATSVEIDNICAIIVQSPDYYGTPHNIKKYRDICDAKGAMLIVVNTEIISYGLLPAPKEADIVVGEAQSLGVAMNFGGPHLGFFACKEKYVRQMPGRICGLTKDIDGNEGFVLTLNAREQHIRRQKATSNICSNQGLNMVAFTIHLALLGRNGLRKLARLNHHLASKLHQQLSKNSKIRVINKYFFNEFVIELPIAADIFLKKMLAKNIMAGVKIAENRVLLAVTEMNSQDDINYYCETVKEIL